MSSPAMHTSRSTTTSRRQYCGAPRGVTFRFPAQLRKFRCAVLQPGNLNAGMSVDNAKGSGPTPTTHGVSFGSWTFFGPTLCAAPCCALPPYCLCLSLGFRRGGSSAADDAEQPCPSLRIDWIHNESLFHTPTGSRLLDYPVHHRMSRGFDTMRRRAARREASCVVPRDALRPVPQQHRAASTAAPHVV